MMQISGTSPSAFQVPYNSFKEKFESSGANTSDVHSSNDELQEKESKDLDYDFICFFLSTKRLDLYRSIDFRCEDMLLGKRNVLAYVAFYIYLYSLRYTSVGYYSYLQDFIILSCLFSMLDDGILSESKWLLDLGLMPNSNSATRAIGYRQVYSHLFCHILLNINLLVSKVLCLLA